MTTSTIARRRWVAVPLAVVAAATMALTGSGPAQAAPAEKSLFVEQTASAFWTVPHECADGSIAAGTLLVQPTLDYESPDTEDPEPTVRVQFQAVCDDGTSYTWGAFAIPATITSDRNLKRLTASGSGIARDIFGVSHEVTFDVTWTGVGPLETTVNGPGSKRQQRAATATGQVTFDGELIVNGATNHPTRPAPFIRVDTERG